MEFTANQGGGFKPAGNVALSIKRQSSEASLIDDVAVPEGLRAPRSADNSPPNHVVFLSPWVMWRYQSKDSQAKRR